MEKVKKAMALLQEVLSEYGDAKEDHDETLQRGEKIDDYQDGNTSNANEDGNVDYSKFDNLSKKMIMKQKMLKGM